MAYEQEKIDEAIFFLAKIQKSVSERDFFAVKYFSSAFFTAARSVFQYANKEIEFKKGGKAWYDSHMKSPVFKHLQKTRNLVIHVSPLDVKMSVNVYMGTPTRIQVKGHSIRHFIGGNEFLPSEEAPQHPTEETTETTKTQVATTFLVEGWEGEEDVITLGKKYIDAITKFVEDGISKGLLPPSEQVIQPSIVYNNE